MIDLGHGLRLAEAPYNDTWKKLINSFARKQKTPQLPKIEDPMILWVILNTQDELVGYTGMRAADEHTMHMGPTGLAEEIRGKGLQRILIKIREQKALSLGYSEAISIVDAWNRRSMNNLIREGYLTYRPEGLEEVNTSHGEVFFYKELK